MINAIVTSHLSNGYWNYRGGYELNLAYIAIALALALAGPGPGPSTGSPAGMTS